MFSADTSSCCSLPFSVAARRSKNRRYTLDQDCLEDSAAAGDIVVSSARQSYRSSIDTEFGAGNSNEESFSRGEEDIVDLNSEDSCYHCILQRKTSKNQGNPAFSTDLAY